ncbi:MULTISPECIES: hypothetical protein [unclassified Pseudomonas]|uniref:hypothetical protein n=1 Tax=unclassified Pseudomonas TaxID=196821 RepID=UPI0011477A04|nr:MULTISPECIES: hypothetical protein [unclassified Pseudomonas]QOF85659.1 hypothetical protein IG194_02840 [Pseudomonas sp. ADPe]
MMLEIGDIERFADTGEFTSHALNAANVHYSNGKKKRDCPTGSQEGEAFISAKQHNRGEQTSKRELRAWQIAINEDGWHHPVPTLS